MNESQTLSYRTIERMFARDKESQFLYLQVLDSTKVKHRGLKCALLLLSDGVHMNHCYYVPKSSVIRELIMPEKYAIIMVKHYYRSITETPNGGTKIFIEIDSLLVVGPRAATIGHIIGDPKQFDETHIVKRKAILTTKILAKKAQLTRYSLATILEGEYVKQPIVQILSAKLVTDISGKENIMLDICDGGKIVKVSCSQQLTRQLEPYMEDLQLSIVQLDKYIFANDRIAIDKITWLNWGSHVCFNKNIEWHRAPLSGSCIREIITNSCWIRNPVVKIEQVLRIQNESEHKTRTRLKIFDGHVIGDAYLSSQLEQSLHGLLTKRCVIRLDVYKANKVNPKTIHGYRYERSSITIFGLTLLNHAITFDFQWKLMDARPKLSEYSISNKFAFKDPVVRIIKVDVILNGVTGKNCIRLLIFDGIDKCNAYLPSRMNYLRNYVEHLPIVRLDAFTLDYKKIDRKTDKLTITQMTGLYVDNFDMPNENF